jgi:hypothetical protein
MSAGQVSGTLIGQAATASHAVAALTDGAQLREPTAAAKPSGRLSRSTGYAESPRCWLFFFTSVGPTN